ncbi:MAG: hypothetical protein U0451_00595 [Candidatus Saccharimonadales bacterium]
MDMMPLGPEVKRPNPPEKLGRFLTRSAVRIELLYDRLFNNKTVGDVMAGKIEEERVNSLTPHQLRRRGTIAVSSVIGAGLVLGVGVAVERVTQGPVNDLIDQQAQCIDRVTSELRAGDITQYQAITEQNGCHLIGSEQFEHNSTPTSQP